MPEIVSMLHLPPCGPELHLAETMFRFPKARHVAKRGFVAADRVKDRVSAGWPGFAVAPDRIRAPGSRARACVNGDVTRRTPSRLEHAHARVLSRTGIRPVAGGSGGCRWQLAEPAHDRSGFRLPIVRLFRSALVRAAARHPAGGVRSC